MNVSSAPGLGMNYLFAFGGIALGGLVGATSRIRDEALFPDSAKFALTCEENCKYESSRYITGVKLTEGLVSWPATLLVAHSLSPYFFATQFGGKTLHEDAQEQGINDLITHGALYGLTGLMWLCNHNLGFTPPISGDVMLKVSAGIMHMHALEFATDNGKNITMKVASYGILTALTDYQLLHNMTKNCNTIWESTVGALIAIAASVAVASLRSDYEIALPSRKQGNTSEPMHNAYSPESLASRTGNSRRVNASESMHNPYSGVYRRVNAN